MRAPRLTVAEASVEDYAHRLRSVCGAFDVLPADGRGKVRGSVSMLRHGPFEIAEVQSDSKVISRDGRCIRRDPGEHLFLIMQRAGRARMAQGARSVLLRPGGFVLIDSVLPSEFRYEGPASAQLSVHLPRAEFLQRFGRAAPAAMSVDGEAALAGALRGVVQEVVADASADKLGFLREAFFALLGARLAEEDGGGAPGCGLAREARRVIDRRFRDSALTASAVADAMGVSLRRLQRLLKDCGENPSQLIKSRRLDYARRRLAARRAGAGRDLVATIAYEAGFNDVSYFNKAFRKAYGTAPGALSPPRRG